MDLSEPEDLEVVLKEKVKPLVDEATEKHLGVNINKFTDDITSKLNKTNLLDIEVDTRLSYKESKKKFKKAFLRKLLLLHLGNVSEVARVSGTDRRSIHRLIKGFNINIKKIKKELIRPYEVKLTAMNSLIENVLDSYKTIIHPVKLQEMYSYVTDLSEDILKELPEPRMTFKDAINEFEKRFFQKSLKENNHNIAKTAKRIGLRYETLYRKLKLLKMI